MYLVLHPNLPVPICGSSFVGEACHLKPKHRHFSPCLSRNYIRYFPIKCMKVFERPQRPVLLAVRHFKAVWV